MNKIKKHSDKFYIQQVNAESLGLIPNTKKDLEQDFLSLIYKSLTNSHLYCKINRSDGTIYKDQYNGAYLQRSPGNSDAFRHQVQQEEQTGLQVLSVEREPPSNRRRRLYRRRQNACQRQLPRSLPGTLGEVLRQD